jgi:hypothetical protein
MHGNLSGVAQRYVPVSGIFGSCKDASRMSKNRKILFEAESIKECRAAEVFEVQRGKEGLRRKNNNSNGN